MLNKFIWFILNFNFCLLDEYFKQDIGDKMKIGVPERGYKSVQLKCGADSMNVFLETDDDFYGVIYTRGSFDERSGPCFVDTGNSRGQRSFRMQFNLDECNTKMDDDLYSNTLILQHDKELIMPGDAAFNLECDFRNPRDITVNANLQNEYDVISRITLTDPDPSLQDNKRNKRNSIENHINVTITPELLNLRKEEL